MDIYSFLIIFRLFIKYLLINNNQYIMQLSIIFCQIKDDLMPILYRIFILPYTLNIAL
jgi:hypothetical protein